MKVVNLLQIYKLCSICNNSFPRRNMIYLRDKYYCDDCFRGAIKVN